MAEKKTVVVASPRGGRRGMTPCGVPRGAGAPPWAPGPRVMAEVLKGAKKKG